MPGIDGITMKRSTSGKSGTILGSVNFSISFLNLFQSGLGSEGSLGTSIGILNIFINANIIILKKSGPILFLGVVPWMVNIN